LPYFYKNSGDKKLTVFCKEKEIHFCKFELLDKRTYRINLADNTGYVEAKIENGTIRLSEVRNVRADYA
jgi:hypothetical protein